MIGGVGGASEIRTHGGVAPSLVFKTSALNRSAIAPASAIVPARAHATSDAKFTSTIRPVIRAAHFHRIAVFALATFVAMVCVTGLTPMIHPASPSIAYEQVCSADGTKQFVAVGDTAPSHEMHDHAAHCPLCMPVGAPPSVFIALFEPVQPLARVRQSIPAARLAGLVGAPLPARGPPSFA